MYRNYVIRNSCNCTHSMSSSDRVTRRCSGGRVGLSQLFLGRAHSADLALAWRYSNRATRIEC